MITSATDSARERTAAAGERHGQQEVDGRAVRARLRRIRELLIWLADLGPVDPPRLIDEPATALAVERILTLLVDLALACNSDVAASVLDCAPKTYEDSFDLAAQAGMITPELAEQLRPSASMRNVLVHRSLEADQAQVAMAVPRAPGLYGEYVAQVAAYVAGRAA
ncbi:MAG TPA: HepT-like ribonuclease domain-containing protein [Pseudonocardia sp.]